MAGIGRRAVLGGGLATLAAGRVRAAAEKPLAALLEASGLAPVTACMIVDLDSGAVLEAHQPDREMPPASVAKVVTALYGLAVLGPEHRFRTRLLADGPLAGGRIAGALVLEGGGDPVLDSDDLAAMLRAARVAGVTAADRLVVADGALPGVALIDAGQPDEAAYNPAISGMNLNFNRVWLGWEPGKAGPVLRFAAPGERVDPEVPGFGARLADQGAPRRQRIEGRDVWTLARGALPGRGSIWLPVADPPGYAGAAARALGAAVGMTLPAAEVTGTAAGAALVIHDSPPLEPVLREMLRYSTNLTAEVVGLAAGQARGLAPVAIGPSAAAMTDWARARYGLSGAVLTSHSGLTGDCRIAPEEMVAILRAEAGGALPGLLRPRPIVDRGGEPAAAKAVRAVAKTGTLDFVSGLAGYLDGQRQLAFAIFSADLDRRAAIRPEERSAPPGAKGWAGRARALERALLQRWAVAYAAGPQMRPRPRVRG